MGNVYRRSGHDFNWLSSSASTDEGGKGASIRCVPDWLNGFYGYLWNTFRGEQVSTNNFVKGSKFRITLEGCDFGGRSKKSKRQENSLVLNRNGNCEFDTRGISRI